ncbi:hypothetical protein, conserved [Trypanosoma brucei gambiense DAL972]|uniref:Cilia- and flagella-associated protein 300 n=1 Tax=Trypanosoma brucei gambiense (strain MHOM/CI/86/DAL972) TaxID=679716 RepID=C9ZM71_TRYB9|nr:hypothetical protein, conserved [Trypanosoma brucei gambiense DAL972]CBH10744.1 hypothetical protein, conserved [Trypanosoma brucei gambiense DAL972]|eukprot:XP_011773032.1 hypothetical protein, conserved [Trypanosoma brucei gambiense DAL972]
MVQREVFTFEPISKRRLETLMADPFFKEAYRRWGLQHRTKISAFRFERDTTGTNSGTVGTVVSGHFRFFGFHKGLLQEFLTSLFDAPEVREKLQLRGEPKGTSSSGGGVEYCELQCRWTTLEPFKRLIDAEIVRCVEDEDKGDEAKGTVMVSEFETPLFDGVRMPIVKRADVYLPHDIVVCDELRALFLLAHNKFASVGCEYDEDDDYMGSGAFTFGSCAGLSLAVLRTVFGDVNERAEFLYHILWRLVAGGGTTNQWDDELTVYLEATRMLYKALVSIRAVPTAAAAGAAATNGADEPDRVVEMKDTPHQSLQPDVVSTVVSVHAVAGLHLFDRDDGASPNNLNYCYVCIDPLLGEVVVWYHSF